VTWFLDIVFAFEAHRHENIQALVSLSWLILVTFR